MKHLFRPVYAALAVLTLYLFICGTAEMEWDPHGNLLAHNYGLWGDWSVHFSFISNLLERGTHWITGDNPLYAGMPFQYPFLSHLLTALVAVVFRLDTIRATFWVSAILCAVLPVSLFRFYQAFKIKPWTALAAVMLFLLIGGFQIFDPALQAREPLTNQGTLGSVFTQFFLFEVIPQRAFLFGLVFFSSLGTGLIKKCEAQNWNRSQFVGVALLIALSSCLHMHTWIACSALLVFSAALVVLPSGDRKLKIQATRKTIFFLGVVTAGISAFFIYFLLMRRQGADQSGLWKVWFPGWAQNASGQSGKPQEMNFVWFWLYNTGFFLPLSITGSAWGYSNRKENGFFFPLMITGWFLYLFSLFINIQPSYYDNLKIITYSFLMLAPVAALTLEQIATHFGKIGLVISVLLLGIQSSTAVSDLEFTRSHQHTATFFTREEIFLAEDFKAIRSSPDALVLINPVHNHWLPCLAGNPIYMGYPGWLWSWSIDYGKREKKIDEILFGRAQALDFVRESKVDYIVVRNEEHLRDQGIINVSFLKAHFPIVLQKYGWMVFSTRNAMSPSSSVR